MTASRRQRTPIAAPRREDASRREHSFRARAVARRYRRFHRNCSKPTLVTLHRFFPTLAAGLVALASQHVVAAGFTGQQDALLEIEAARAPLTVSGDGAWRLHVDAHDVLHRVRIADATSETTLQLPHGVRALSASSDGLKVALSTDHGCIGLVDFGSRAGDAARLSWRPWVLGADGVPIGPEVAGWVAPMPADCGDPAFDAPVAISSDGRLVATTDAVVDTATNRVVASLPMEAATVLRLQFVDHDARLLIASASLGERRESPAQPSGLSFSVWDLASGALVDDVEVMDTRLDVAAALQVDVSAQTGALFFIDERRRERARRDAAPGTPPVPLPLDLVQLAPGACGTPPRVRAQVGDDVGASFVVDPYGRWFASAHALTAARDAAELASGARWALVVQDMASGRQWTRITSRYALNGLVATPDGARLFALASQPIEPETRDAIAGWPVVPDDERVVEVMLPDAATTAPRDSAKAWDRGFCRESGEAPGARAMARSEHALKPLWSRDLDADTAPAHAARSLATCANAASGLALFRSPDGSLWLDLSTQVAQLDALTGNLSAGLPTPRTDTVCSVVTPSGAGFLSASGDTLTWRPLTAATDPARRRVVARRPGWRASLLGAHGDGVRVAWSAAGHDVVVTEYDSNGRRLHDARTPETAFDNGANGDSPSMHAACHDDHGTPLAIGYDWRAGPFGSQRGSICGPLPGVARLVWWSGASIAPRADRSAPTPRAAPAIDGATAVFADDATLHVVNLALQREIAQIAAPDGRDVSTWVLASRRLVLVESTGGDGHRRLRAYALP